MINDSMLVSAVGFAGLSVGILAQIANGIPTDPTLNSIPWASFASSGTMVVGMALALKYTAGRQLVNEAAVKEAHEKHIATLLDMLQQEKTQNVKEREMLSMSLNRLGDALDAIAKLLPDKLDVKRI